MWSWYENARQWLDEIAEHCKRKKRYELVGKWCLIMRIKLLPLFAAEAIVNVLMMCPSSYAASHAVRVCVRDQSGGVLVDAHLSVVGNAQKGATTGADGCSAIEVNSGDKIQISHAGFRSTTQAIGEGSPLFVVLSVGAEQVIEVTAARTPLALDASANSVRVMPSSQLQEAPGFTLDDRLRQVAGFQLFRRTSSWVANPTTEGTSLRGLGSTAASRTLVLSDQVPLNDPFGGWIHWNEIPSLAVQEVELMRGGASDLYGSSAIGGVIDVVPRIPKHSAYVADISGASLDTASLNGLLMGNAARWSGLGAVSLFRTDGYILIAPQSRGPVDIASNVHSQSGRAELRERLGAESDIFLLGNLLNEARSNGTPLQSNGTRIWRYIAGGDWSTNHAGRLLTRLYGTNQKYRQSFSVVNPTRTSERLTSFHRYPSQVIGGTVQWAGSHGAMTLVAGADAIDNRGDDSEQISQTSLSARQRSEGIYGEVLWQPASWSIAFSSRLDHFASFDARQAGGASTVLPDIGENVFDPRLGVVKNLTRNLSLTGSAFRAFRGPTMNELYRQGQVGQQITLPNPLLKSERATGFELGSLVEAGRFGSVRSSYFLTQVNRPVAAITLISTPTSTLLKRENLGQLTSKGLTLEWELQPAAVLSVTGGYQLAFSTVTKFQADSSLAGKWVPQVPRNSASLQVRFEKERIGTLAMDLRTSGRQFDDSANQFMLNGYAQLDLYAARSFGEKWQLYTSVQNLLDQPMQAGRTPILTLGSPRIVTLGVRLH